MRAHTSFMALVISSLLFVAGCEKSSVPKDVVSKAQVKPVATEHQPADIAVEPTPQAPDPAPTSSTRKPMPKGLLTFESISPSGSESVTTMLASRTARSGLKVATLQIDRSDSSTLMDVAFDCPAKTYVYLFMDHNARPVDEAKIARVQFFSDKQLTAFSRGEALQKLTFSKLDTFPPEDVTDYTRIMDVTCE